MSKKLNRKIYKTKFIWQLKFRWQANLLGYAYYRTIQSALTQQEISILGTH